MFGRLSAEPRQHAAAVPLQVDYPDTEADPQSQRSAARADIDCLVACFVVPLFHCPLLTQEILGNNDRCERQDPAQFIAATIGALASCRS